MRGRCPVRHVGSPFPFDGGARQHAGAGSFQLLPRSMWLLDETAYMLRGCKASSARGTLETKLRFKGKLRWCRCSPNRKGGVVYDWQVGPDKPGDINLARYPLVAGHDTHGCCWVRRTSSCNRRCHFRPNRACKGGPTRDAGMLAGDRGSRAGVNTRGLSNSPPLLSDTGDLARQQRHRGATQVVCPDPQG